MKVALLDVLLGDSSCTEVDVDEIATLLFAVVAEDVEVWVFSREISELSLMDNDEVESE